MAITNFIPTVWSEMLHKELSKKYVAVANCNRDFDGDIKELGSQVKICGVMPVNVFQYTKNTDMDAPQVLSDTGMNIEISRATAFNFAVDDIDRVQSIPSLAKAALANAADALANDADKFVYSLYSEVPENRIIWNENGTAENIINDIIKAREKLYDGNVTDASDIVIEVSPAVASLLLKAKLMLGSSDNATTLTNGCIGKICGCSVYVSKNVAVEGNNYKCFIRTKRAIAFVDQFTEICAYRPESRFADAVKGLHLYGAKIVYPNEIVLLDIYPAE